LTDMNLPDSNLREIIQTLTQAERDAVERLAAGGGLQPLTLAERDSIRKIKARLKRRARQDRDRRVTQ